eukprot:CAMPEP_0172409962 /NCGR_PEP_ID=MMETSP1061-20121228/76623_1 /TAXON_ID=37318 /ORGANISM="Pseudo-nitzschia pungens, Strain cf. pungens" /LENGTH=70 /DNA_ID=CAMNT_0013146127 /DNA_START=884 /DNA_END=1096 /DNA_ORIENTATION=+
MSYTSGLFAQAARHVQQDDLDGTTTKRPPWYPASKMSYTSGLFAQAARHVQQDDLDGIPLSRSNSHDSNM